MEHLLAVKHNASTNSYTAVNTNTEQIECTIRPGHAKSESQTPITTTVFPDSGATICLAGPQHLAPLGVSLSELIPTNKKITVVGGSTLPCLGWIPAVFTVDNASTEQPLYICYKVDRIFFSKEACISTFILPRLFPQPTPALKYLEPINNETKSKLDPGATAFNLKLASHPLSEKGYRRTAPPRPNKIPFAAVESSIPQLRKYIVDAFSNSALDKSPPFPMMKAKKAHIHLQPNAIPYAVHLNTGTTPRKSCCQSTTGLERRTRHHHTHHWHTSDMVRSDGHRQKERWVTTYNSRLPTIESTVPA